MVLNYVFDKKNISLHRKTFSASAGACSVRIFKDKSFSVQPSEIVEFSADDIEHTFFINNYADSFIFKDLVKKKWIS